MNTQDNRPGAGGRRDACTVRSIAAAAVGPWAASRRAPGRIAPTVGATAAAVGPGGGMALGRGCGGGPNAIKDKVSKYKGNTETREIGKKNKVRFVTYYIFPSVAKNKMNPRSIRTF